MDDAKCEYYRAINKMLQVDCQDKVITNPVIKAEVDELLLDLTIKESRATRQCLPDISSYTNCNKHNLCLGCTRCSCSAAGNWECRRWQQCRQQSPLEVDHHLLVELMEYIDDSSRSIRTKAKRSIHTNVSPIGTEKEENFTSQEISSLINGFNNTSDNKQAGIDNVLNTADMEMDAVTEILELMNATEKNESLDQTDLDFDDLFPEYYNLSIGDAAKLLLPMLKNHTEDILDTDYIEIPDENVTEIDKGNIEKILDFSNLDANAKKTPAMREAYDLFERQSVRVVKRQIINTTRSLRNQVLLNNSKRSIQDLTDNVLHPLLAFINTKRNELQELENMRDYLQEYIRMYIRNETFLKINKTLLENLTKTYVAFYKMEILPDIQKTSVQNKLLSLDDYESKLERDIYEVISDIIGIQEHSNYKDLPENLNILIQAMKYYIHKQGKVHVMREFQRITENNMNMYKKFIELNSNEFAVSSAPSVIKQILIVIDKEMPRSNALAPLSTGAKKILNRLVNYDFGEKYNLKNRSILKPQYNMANDLKDVGIKWYKMTRGIASSHLSDRLYSMKLLHLEISKDIAKINDALTFIQNSQTRRFMLFDKDTSERYASRIGEDIKIVYVKLQEILKQQNEDNVKKIMPITVTTRKQKAKKKSFLQQVKKILKQSKKDFVKVFRSNVKDDLSEQIQNIKRQKDTKGKLNRIKRSSTAFNKSIRRIKNIIPDYLKRKFNGAKNFKTVTKKL
ncbi:hypothetical protein RR48_03451 [Papilio machaon]|uniref:Uncharacterized protein n=1 Tax=Papilio machaon TaxID=76193 RepID=A0A0N1PI88_PAPMA|nr:hypothetical protein RR48_03451 [Papilio machaon]